MALRAPQASNDIIELRIPSGEVRQHTRAADVLIDAHVWMRRREARMNRPLPLDNVSDKKNLEPLKKPDDVNARVWR